MTNLEVGRPTRDRVRVYGTPEQRRKRDVDGRLLSCNTPVGTNLSLVSAYVGAVEKGEGKVWKAADVNFVGTQARSLANGVVVSELDMGKRNIPVVLTRLDRDPKNLSHCWVNTFGATIGLWGMNW